MDEIKVYLGMISYIFIYKNSKQTQMVNHNYNLQFEERGYDVNELYIKRCKTRNKIMTKTSGSDPYAKCLISPF